MFGPDPDTTEVVFVDSGGNKLRLHVREGYRIWGALGEFLFKDGKLVPVSSGEWTPGAALAAAHELICKAGFELKYESPSGSRYYHLPGRRGGMIRLANHAKEKSEGTSAMLTIHQACFPRSIHKLERMVAETIGWYFLRTIAI